MKNFRFACAIAAATCIVPQLSYAVTITPIFADTYTGTDYGLGPIVSLDGNSNAQAAILAATSQIGSLFSNDLSVNILYYGVNAGTNAFLGASTTGYNVYTYQDYVAALSADAAANPQNTVLTTAVANLGSGNGANNPLAYVAPTTANARALGLSDASPGFDSTGAFVGGNGTADAIVFINLDQPFSYSRPIPDFTTGVYYDAQSTMEHETDEVLGVGGSGSTLNDLLHNPNFGADATGVAGASVYGVEDLYRYSAPGVASYVVNPNIDFGQSAYFSIDGGVTSVDTFNQEAMAYGDAADWGLAQNCQGGGIGGAGNVQDAFSCSNQSPDVTTSSPEYVAFQAIGYNAVPEPQTWIMLLVGFFGIGGLLRRQTPDHRLA